MLFEPASVPHVPPIIHRILSERSVILDASMPRLSLSAVAVVVSGIGV